MVLGAASGSILVDASMFVVCARLRASVPGRARSAIRYVSGDLICH